MKRWLILGLVLVALAAGWLTWRTQAIRHALRAAPQGPMAKEFLEGYARIASESYLESWERAQTLRLTLDGFAQQPSAASLEAARNAWSAAHAAFVRTDPFRFSGGPIDNKPMGNLYLRIDPWPIDPNKVDTMQDSRWAGVVHDSANTPEISVQTLIPLHRPEEGVAVLGFQPLACLLWGWPPRSRDASDFAPSAISARRKAYAAAASEHLVSSVKQLVDAWDPIQIETYYRRVLLAEPPEKSIQAILNGLAALCESGLGGRVTRPLESAKPMDVSSPFSGESANDIKASLAGLKAIYVGESVGGEAHRVKAKVSLRDWIASADSGRAQGLFATLEKAETLAAGLSEPLTERKAELAALKSQLAKAAKHIRDVAQRMGLGE